MNRSINEVILDILTNHPESTWPWDVYPEITTQVAKTMIREAYHTPRDTLLDNDDKIACIVV